MKCTERLAYKTILVAGGTWSSKSSSMKRLDSCGLPASLDHRFARILPLFRYLSPPIAIPSLQPFLPETILLMLYMVVLLLHLHVVLMPPKPANGVYGPLILPVRPPCYSQCRQDPNHTHYGANGFPVDMGAG